MASTQIPKTTHAIEIDANGGLDVIQFREVATVAPKEDELFVKVEWAGVNFIDTYFRGGVYPTAFPFRLGQEGSGTIISLPTSSATLESEAYKARGFNIGDKVVWYDGGSFAGHKAVKWTKVAKLPNNIDPRIGAAVFTQGLTALTFVNESYEVKKGDYILVHAAAGGLGLLLTQIITGLGAHVIGTTSTQEKAELVKANGAEHVVLYTKNSVVDKVLEVTNGAGVAAVFDGVGKDTWEDNFKLLARKGTIVSIGNASGVVPPFSPLKLTPKNLKVLRPTVANYLDTPEEFTHYTTKLFELVAGGLNVKIHKEYPFSAEGVKQAQQDISGRGTTGKLVIKID